MFDQMSKSFILLLAVVSLCLISACSKESSDSPSSSTTDTGTTSTGVENHGQEISGGGGETLHLGPKETKKVLQKSYQWLTQNEAWLLRFLLGQKLNLMTSRRVIDLEAPLNMSSLSPDDFFFEYFVDRRQALLRAPLDPSMIQPPINNWEAFRDSVLAPSLIVHFDDCSELKSRYQGYPAAFDAESGKICFNIHKIKLEPDGSYTQAMGIILHELTHVYQHSQGFDYRSEAFEEQSRKIQQAFYSFYSSLHELRSNHSSVETIRSVLKIFDQARSTVCERGSGYHYLKGALDSLEANQPIRLFPIRSIIEIESLSSAQETLSLYDRFIVALRDLIHKVDAMEMTVYRSAPTYCKTQEEWQELAPLSSRLKELLENTSSADAQD